MADKPKNCDKNCDNPWLMNWLVDRITIQAVHFSILTPTKQQRGGFSASKHGSRNQPPWGCYGDRLIYTPTTFFRYDIIGYNWVIL